MTKRVIFSCHACHEFLLYGSLYSYMFEDLVVKFLAILREKKPKEQIFF